jgi:hypothetical protein
MRSADVSRGLVPLAIVTLVAIPAISAIGVALGALPTPEQTHSALASTALLDTPAPSPSEPTADHSPAPEPTPEPTRPPAPSVQPAPDDDLALAGRDRMPVRLYCRNHRTFGFDDLENPTGAELRVGPEFDVLRSVVGNPPTRELARDETGVTFLADRRDPGPWEGGPYLYIDVNRHGSSWEWAGYGDCEPRAWAPPGFGAATWVLDPAFRAPSATTQTLHLLVREFACSSGRTAHGRIGPAYVTSDPFTVRIQLLVQNLPGEQDCVGVDPTSATLRLPERLEDRTRKDMNAHYLNAAGG